MEVPETCKAEITWWLSHIHPVAENLSVEVVQTKKQAEGTDSGAIISQWVKTLLKGEEVADINSDLQLVRYTMALEIAQARARI